MATEIENEQVSGLRQRQWQQREQLILQMAQEMIAAGGYDNVTMDSLAAQVGISKPTLYQHFPSKEAIAIRSVIATMERGLERIRSMPADMPPRQKLREILRESALEKFTQHRNCFGTAYTNLIPVIRSHPDYQALRTEILSRLADLIRQGQAEGAIRSGLEPRVAAQAIISTIRDGEYREMIAAGEVSLDTVVGTLLTIVLDGISTNP